MTIKEASKEFNNPANCFSITHEEMLASYDREFERLMALPKEELVYSIIGKREHVGILFG